MLFRSRIKADLIKSRGKEHHHGTSIDQSAKEFAGLTPEQRREKRKKDAEGGKFHGSDPRNLIQTNKTSGEHGIPHRGSGGYHSSQKPVGSGGSIQNFGSEKEIVAQQRSTQASIRKTGMTHQERLAKEKGIITPRRQGQINLKRRMSNSPLSQQQRRTAQIAHGIIRNIRNS